MKTRAKIKTKIKSKAKMLILVLSQLLVQSLAVASTASLIGQLKQDSSGVYTLVAEQGSYPLAFPANVKAQAKSLLGKVPFVEITQGDLQNGVIKTNAVPTIISGNKILQGRLMPAGQNYPGLFQINGVPAVFGRTKSVNDTHFDAKSIAYFTGRTVRTIGFMRGGTFVIQSILRSDVFSATAHEVMDADVPQELVTSLDQDPSGTALDLLKNKIKSPSPAWFRKTLFAQSSQSPRPGDVALVISASGAQGDDTGAINGHFAAGMARVGEDLQLNGEMYNIYVTNEKEIVPGNGNMNDYFGHLISGQNNYRPTYTLVLYGLSEAQITKMKNQLDRFYPLFRTGNTKITANANCAIYSVEALADMGVYGTQRNGSNGQGSFVLLSQQKAALPGQSIPTQLNYVLKTKRAEFMPGPAMISLLENLSYLNQQENLGITRADFIFGGQTPSARANGAAPTRGILNQFKHQGGMKLKDMESYLKRLN